MTKANSFLYLLAAVSALVPVNVTAAPRQKASCQSSRMSVSVPPESPMELSRHKLRSGSGQVWGSLAFNYKGQRTLHGVALVVEYFGADRGSLFSMSYGSVTLEHKPRFHPPISFEFQGTFPQPVSTSGNVEVGGLKFTTTPVCPSHAEITFLFLDSGDPSPFVWSRPGWKTDALLDHFPNDRFVFPPSLVKPPNLLLIEIAINSQGRVREVNSISEQSPDLLKALLRGMAKWSFTPAMEDGTPVESKLLLCFRFLREGESLPEIQEPLPPNVLVALVSDRIQTEKWTVWYGTRVGGTSRN